jgi:hypothetical protein
MVVRRGASTWSSSLIALTRREPNVALQEQLADFLR